MPAALVSGLVQGPSEGLDFYALAMPDSSCNHSGPAFALEHG